MRLLSPADPTRGDKVNAKTAWQAPDRRGLHTVDNRPPQFLDLGAEILSERAIGGGDDKTG